MPALFSAQQGVIAQRPLSAATPIILDGLLTRLEDDIIVGGKTGPNPWIRNSNISGAYDEVKAGPRSIIRDGVNSYRMWWEAVGTSSVNFVGYATSTNGVDWTKYSGNPVMSASEAWEAGEVAPTSVVWDPVNAQYVLYYHGGNNTGPRQIGRATSPDGITWTKDTGNPILVIGGSGAFDEKDCADAKVLRLSTSNWIMIYRGNVPSGLGRIGRATSSDGITWTKDPASPVIDIGTGWESNGAFGNSTPLIDSNGRWHMWYMGMNSSDIQTTGYAYSDNQGVTWTKGANNPVLIANNEADAPDKLGAGDTAEATHDGDKVLVTYYGLTLTGYTGTGGVPNRSICASYLPLKVNAPSIPGRFFAAGNHVNLAASLTLLDNATYTIVVRAKVYRDDAYREIYTEQAAFNKLIFLRLDNTGVLTMHHRTPAAIVSFSSTQRYDDNHWHTFAMRRNSSDSFDLIADGVVLGSSASNPGTIADAPTSVPTYGNWASASGLNEPLLGTISRIAVWDNAALSLSEITAFSDNQALPGAGSPLWWHNPGSGSPEPDKSGSGNTGTVSGTTIVDGALESGIA